MGKNFAGEEVVDGFGEGHALGVAQVGIGLRCVVLVEAGGCLLVAFGKRGEDGLEDGGRELDAPGLGLGLEGGEKGGALEEELVGQGGEDLSDGVLLGPTLGFLGGLDLGILFLGDGEVGEGLLVLQAGDALGGGRKSSLRGRSTVILRKPKWVVG